MSDILIAGSGICGTAAAMMLADDGHQVTVIERDPAPAPPDPNAAFAWQRKSVAQFSLGHWMHARGTTILRNQVPRAYELLKNNGGLPLNVLELLSGQPGAASEPGDDRFDLLTGRRSTIEWALAVAADEHPGVTVRRGEAIAGLTAHQSAPTGTPQVTGVQLQSGEQITADLVVDATGRKSRTPEMLAEIGAALPTEAGEESGFAYYGRYFSSPDGSLPAMLGPLLSQFGSFSLLTLPADNGTWSVTLYGMADDKPLRRFREPEVYERVIRALPRHQHWLDGEPIDEQKFMAGGVDRRRRFVIDGRPCATGILTVADASACTNPSLGRGMTLGLMHVESLRSCIAEHLGDPTALALAFDERTESELMPFHDSTTALDRRRLNEMRMYRDGEIPEPTDEEKIGDLLAAAAGSDSIAARAYGDVFSCNALPHDVVGKPGVLMHVLGLADTVAIEPLPGPNRDQLLELVG